MKVLLAGAFGNLGADILKKLVADGHEVVAADMMERDLGIEKNYTFQKSTLPIPKPSRVSVTVLKWLSRPSVLLALPRNLLLTISTIRVI